MASVGFNSEIGEIVDIIPCVVPSDFHGQANNGLWVNLANGFRLGVLFTKGVGTAAQDPVITLNQATDNLGTNSKALNFTVYRTKYTTVTAYNQTTQTVWTRTIQAAANTLTLTGQAAYVGMVLIEVKETDLDMSNGFNHVQAAVANVGANAQVCTLTYLMLGLDYVGVNPLNALN